MGNFLLFCRFSTVGLVRGCVSSEAVDPVPPRRDMKGKVADKREIMWLLLSAAAARFHAPPSHPPLEAASVSRTAALCRL